MLFYCPVLGSGKYDEHQTILSNSLFEWFIAVDQSVAPIIERVSGENGMQMEFKVKFLLRYHGNDIWSI